MSDSKFMQVISPTATYVGIDPGSASGAVCVLKEYDGKSNVFIAPVEKYTDRDLVNVLEGATLDTPQGKIKAVIEHQHAFPGMGVSTQFKLAKSFGELRMLLIAFEIPFREVTARKWQGYYNMKKNENEAQTAWKRRLRERAEQLYPDVKLTNKTADSLLIAHYTKMTL